MSLSFFCFDKLRRISPATFFVTTDYINDGVYGSFNCILFDHQVVHPYVLTNGRSFFPSVLTKEKAAQGSTSSLVTLEPSSVWGPTCDSIDCVCPLTALPSNLEVGDWLGFEDMGAYTICAASQFNGFETSSVTYTSGGVGVDSRKVRKLLKGLADAVVIGVGSTSTAAGGVTAV